MEETIKVGDSVLIEQAWEDEQGSIHDEVGTVKRVLPDGRLKFRILKSLGVKEYQRAKIQAWINKMDWYAADVQKI